MRDPQTAMSQRSRELVELLAAARELAPQLDPIPLEGAAHAFVHVRLRARELTTAAQPRARAPGLPLAVCTNVTPLRLLVPVDFSPPSRRALAWAFDYAQRAPCAVHLLHVVDRVPHPGDFNSRDTRQIEAEFRAIARAAEQELDRMAPSEEERADVGPLRYHTGNGKVAQEIVAIADRLGAELIIMGTHGRTGVRRAVIGSVAEAVVRRAPCTVVCVKPTTSPSAP